MEFVEAIKIENRICNCYFNDYKCGKCPLDKTNNEKDLHCNKFINTYPKEAEKIIMKWAEEHPVKTNEDEFNEIFSDFSADIIELIESCKYDCSNYPNCYGCKRKEAIEFWNKEYKEVSKNASSN